MEVKAKNARFQANLRVFLNFCPKSPKKRLETGSRHHRVPQNDRTIAIDILYLVI